MSKKDNQEMRGSKPEQHIPMKIKSHKKPPQNDGLVFWANINDQTYNDYEKAWVEAERRYEKEAAKLWGYAVKVKKEEKLEREKDKQEEDPKKLPRTFKESEKIIEEKIRAKEEETGRILDYEERRKIEREQYEEELRILQEKQRKRREEREREEKKRHEEREKKERSANLRRIFSERRPQYHESRRRQ